MVTHSFFCYLCSTDNKAFVSAVAVSAKDRLLASSSRVGQVQSYYLDTITAFSKVSVCVINLIRIF